MAVIYSQLCTSHLKPQPTAPSPGAIAGTLTLVQQIPAKSPIVRGLLVGKTQPAIFSFHGTFCLYKANPGYFSRTTMAKHLSKPRSLHSYLPPSPRVTSDWCIICDTHREQDVKLFPYKVAIRLVATKTKGNQHNREADRINRCIMKINQIQVPIFLLLINAPKMQALHLLL